MNFRDGSSITFNFKGFEKTVITYDNFQESLDFFDFTIHT